MLTGKKATTTLVPQAPTDNNPASQRWVGDAE